MVQESKAEDKMVSSGAPAPLGGAGISVSSAIPGVGSGTGPATGQFDSRNGLLGNSVGGATGSPVESGLKADVGSSGGSGHQVESYEVEENQLGENSFILLASMSKFSENSKHSFWHQLQIKHIGKLCCVWYVRNFSFVILRRSTNEV